MSSPNALATVICTILAWATEVAVALGQNQPADCCLAPGNGEVSQPSLSETMADQPQSASCPDLDAGQSCFCPRWTASADCIMLDRLGGASQTLVQRVPNTLPNDRKPGSDNFGNLFTAQGTEALNGDDFQQGFSAGPRIDLIRHGDSGYDWELSYFQIDGWNSNQTVVPNSASDCLLMRTPGRWLEPAKTPGGWIGWIQTNQSATQAMAWDYASRLYNAEFNVRWDPSPRVTMLAGFRWVNLSESLVGALSPPTISWEPPFWNTRTTNNLYGFQIGADGKLFERGRFSINVPIKAGIFDNNAEATTAVSVIAKQVTSGSASTNHAAFVGETGLRCTYQLTDALLLRAGYEVIWIDGVALAPGQIQDSYTTTDNLHNTVQVFGVNCNSGAFYHGATAGLEYSF
jgi:hypothetical protein